MIRRLLAWLRGLGRPGWCPGCRAVRWVHRTPSMTQYPWDGAGRDPNAPWYACRAHSDEYVENMTHLWDDYRAGLM